MVSTRIAVPARPYPSRDEWTLNRQKNREDLAIFRENRGVVPTASTPKGLHSVAQGKRQSRDTLGGRIYDA